MQSPFSLNTHLISQFDVLTEVKTVISSSHVDNHASYETPTLMHSLNNLFPEQLYEEKNTKKAKEILGNLTDVLTEEDCRDITTTIQFLAISWLDEFEQSIFNGQTLQELLHEKGGNKWI